MSAFLGPIHHWVFNKIKFQNEIVNRLIALANQRNLEITPALKEKYGELEDAPLEGIIDTSNIHGWLQKRVALVEYRLAQTIKIILDNGAADNSELQKLFYEIGSSAKQISLPSAAAAYKMLNDTLLDGMPCDRANELLSETDNQVVWRRSICVHNIYWAEVGVDIGIYYQLRESLIAGLLDGSEYEFVKRGEEYLIRRR